MKVVSILGCGWLGKPLATTLFKKGFQVKGSTTSTDKLNDLKELGISPFLVDISMDINIVEFLKTDVLIIAITNKSTDDFKQLIAKIEKSPVKKVIFISTTSVYPSLNKVMTEDSETKETPHFKIEELFRNNINFKTTVIRFAGLFGGKRHPANWFKNGKEIPQPNGFVNMIHREDCIAIIEAILQQDYFGETFNASANHHPKRKDFYIKARQSKGFELPVFKKEEELVWKIISSEKIQKKLNYKFIYNDLLKAL
ncbi:NAD(P)-binding domain-containing protein [Polaribacter porphyrae]|uniref:dTDP-glucose 4,6-dehydratase n=1 Tax=Polaribacter porphyrae TaxID=1137780 RepID=A0A2S7WKA2_9FLAO|nr:NAD(P)H-binding protein [Polaribacter porphyrae]PQJ78038.1 dTDP-glucose 4,6-dehydratase [Polaribacter porphyrae]